MPFVTDFFVSFFSNHFLRFSLLPSQSSDCSFPFLLFFRFFSASFGRRSRSLSPGAALAFSCRLFSRILVAFCLGPFLNLYLLVVYNCVADQAQKCLLPQDNDWNFGVQLETRTGTEGQCDRGRKSCHKFCLSKRKNTICNWKYFCAHTNAALAGTYMSCKVAFKFFPRTVSSLDFWLLPKFLFFLILMATCCWTFSNGLGKSLPHCLGPPFAPLSALLIQLSWWSMAISLIGLFAFL